MSLTCPFCGLVYKRIRNLNLHVKQFHPGQANTLPKSVPSSTVSLLCSVCSTNKCEVRLSGNWEFRRHLFDSHGIDVAVTYKQFDSLDNFITWKNEFERETCSFYVKKHRAATKSGSQKLLYSCHRSGVYKPSGKGIRRVKIKGSKKIGGYCPASLHLQVESDGKCSVKIVSTHWGHDKELAHISLTVPERQFIARQLEANLSMSETLKNVHEYGSRTNMKRLTLLTKKDLYNVSASFSCPNKWMKHLNDDISVTEWIKEMRYVHEESILIHKPRGVVSEEYPTLTKENFCFGIMTRAQASMLKSHGGKVVCVTTTTNINYHVITLMVVDDLDEGFPCLFMFTNQTDKDILTILFSKLLKRLGGSLMTPKLFISDVTQPFHSAWSQTISKPEAHLFCPWNIEETWKKNLNRIQNAEKKSLTYELLQSLMNEPDESIFNQMLPVALQKMLDDVDTKNFGAFVKVNFAKNPKMWAICHRFRRGQSTNSYVDSLQRCLENLQSESKNSKRLDKALFASMNCLYRSTLDHFVAVNSNEIEDKLQDIRTYHKASLTLSGKTVSQIGSKWTVSSNSEQFVVTPYREECYCLLICDDCEACIHRYECNCVNSQLACNMCEHVHLVLSEARRLERNRQSRNFKRSRPKRDSRGILRSKRKSAPRPQVQQTDGFNSVDGGEPSHFEPHTTLTTQSEPLIEKSDLILPSIENEPIPIVATRWGKKLTTLDPKQRALAEEAIADILFEASLGALHEHSVKINDRISSTFSSSLESAVDATISTNLDSSKLVDFLCSFEA